MIKVIKNAMKLSRDNMCGKGPKEDYVGKGRKYFIKAAVPMIACAAILMLNDLLFRYLIKPSLPAL